MTTLDFVLPLFTRIARRADVYPPSSISAIFARSCRGGEPICLSTARFGVDHPYVSAPAPRSIDHPKECFTHSLESTT